MKRPARRAALAALAAALLAAAGCISVSSSVVQYNGDAAVAAALTNAPAAYTRSLSTLTTSNGVAATEIAAGGGVVTAISVNSSKQTDPATTIPVSLAK